MCKSKHNRWEYIQWQILPSTIWQLKHSDKWTEKHRNKKKSLQFTNKTSKTITIHENIIFICKLFNLRIIRYPLITNLLKQITHFPYYNVPEFSANNIKQFMLKFIECHYHKLWSKRRMKYWGVINLEVLYSSVCDRRTLATVSGKFHLLHLVLKLKTE